MRTGVVDFHNHLVPAVDDGAANLDESRVALRAMWEQGVRALIVSPHLRGSLTERPGEFARTLESLDAAFAELRGVVETEFEGLRLERGVELMLDTPQLDLSDDRLRIAGTSYFLVEFPFMMVPPHAVKALYDLKLRGWTPIVAHPERYRNVEDRDVIEDLRSVGCLLQVNAGSVVGRYGRTAEKIAWTLLETGAADYISSDYHARGTLNISVCRDALRKCGGEEQARLLMEENPGRLLEGVEPLPVPPLTSRRSVWQKLLGR